MSNSTLDLSTIDQFSHLKVTATNQIWHATLELLRVMFVSSCACCKWV